MAQRKSIRHPNIEHWPLDIEHGEAVPSARMLRVLAVMLVAFTLGALACGGDKSTPTTPTSPGTPNNPSGMQVDPLRDAARSAPRFNPGSSPTVVIAVSSAAISITSRLSTK
jgi:hypothetical protein